MQDLVYDQARALLLGEHELDPARLLNIIPALPAPLISRVADVADAVPNALWRARLLLAVAVQSPDYERDRTLSRAMEAATMVEDAWWRSSILSEVARQEQLARVRLTAFINAVRAARSIAAPQWRAEAIINLELHPSSEQHMELLEEAFNAAGAIDDAAIRARVLQRLIVAMDGDASVVRDALAATRAIEDSDRRVLAFQALLPYLPGAQRTRALDEALATARRIDKAEWRSARLRDLAHFVPADRRPGVLGEAIAAAQHIQDGRERAQALRDVVPNLTSPPLLVQLLSLVGRLPDHEFHIPVRMSALHEIVLALPTDARMYVLSVALADAPATDMPWKLALRREQLPYLAGDERRRGIADIIRGIGGIHYTDTRRQAMHDLLEYLSPALHADLVAVARSLSDLRLRADVLRGCVGLLSTEDRVAVLRDVLSAAGAYSTPWDRAHVLRALRSLLPDELLGEALALARTLRRAADQADILCALIQRMPDVLLRDALAAAGTITEAGSRLRVLGALMPRLDGRQRGAASNMVREAAREVGDIWEQASVLLDFLPFLDDGEVVLSDLLTAVSATPDSERRSRILREVISLSPHWMPSGDYRPLTDALAVTRLLLSDAQRVDILCDVALMLPQSAERASVIAEALHGVRAIDDAWRQVASLHRVAWVSLTGARESVFAESLAASRTIQDPWLRVAALRELAPYQPESVREDALAIALAAAPAVGDERRRASVPREFLPFLPPRLLPEALSVARTLTNAGQRVQCLRSMIPFLPPDQRAPVLWEAALAARAGGDTWTWAETLAELVPNLTEEQQVVALSEFFASYRATDAPFALKRLIQVSPPVVLAEQILPLARGINDVHWRIDILLEIIPAVPAAQREAVAREAAATVHAIGDAATRVRHYCQLAPYLPQVARHEVLAEAVAALWRIGRPVPLAQALRTLLPFLPDAARPPLLAAAIELIRSQGAAYARADALQEIAPVLPVTLLAPALSIARSLVHAEDRIRALAALAPFLPANQLEGALDIIRKTGAPVEKARVFLDVAPLLPPSEHAAIDPAEGAPDAASTTSDPTEKASAFSDAAPPPAWKREGALADALTAARSVGDAQQRAECLRLLAPFLPEEGRVAALADAMDAIRALDDAPSQTQQLLSVAPLLPPPLMVDALAIVRTMASPSEQGDGLRNLTPHVPDEALDVAVDAARILTEPRAKGMCLLALAERLNGARRAAVRAEAIAATRRIADVGVRAYALRDQARGLPLSGERDIAADALSLVPADAREGYADVLMHLTGGGGGGRATDIRALLARLPEAERHALLEEMVLKYTGGLAADEDDAKTISAWIDERTANPREPLHVDHPYTLNFSIGQAIVGNMIGGANAKVPASDIGDLGLDTRWLVTSSAVEFVGSTTDDGAPGVSGVSVGSKDLGVTRLWTAAFSLHVPKWGDSGIARIHVVPHSARDHRLDIQISVKDELYRQFVVELRVAQGTPEDPSSTSDAATIRDDVRHTAIDQTGLLMLPDWQRPPGRLTISVQGQGDRANVFGEAITTSGPLDMFHPVAWRGSQTTLAGLINDVRRAADEFREEHTGYLDAIDATDVLNRLNGFAVRWRPPRSWDNIPGESDPDHRDGWQDVASSDQLRELAYCGHRLYEACFPHGSELRSCLDSLVPGHRIDILWHDGVPGWLPHVPWNLMYAWGPPDDDPVDPFGFLGLRFRLRYAARARTSPPGSKALGGLADTYRPTASTGATSLGTRSRRKRCGSDNSAHFGLPRSVYSRGQGARTRSARLRNC